MYTESRTVLNVPVHQGVRIAYTLLDRSWHHSHPFDECQALSIVSKVDISRVFEIAESMFFKCWFCLTSCKLFIVLLCFKGIWLKIFLLHFFNFNFQFSSNGALIYSKDRTAATITSILQLKQLTFNMVKIYNK